MRWLVIVGIVLMLVGGGLMIKGYVTTEQKHSANIFGARLSVTETDETRIPVVVSGAILGVGAALAIIGALRGKPTT